MQNLNLMLNLKIASDVDVLVTKDGQTIAEMKTAHRSVFVRADLRAHLFGFILTFAVVRYLRFWELDFYD